MAVTLKQRLQAGGPGASVDADLMMLVKTSDPASSDITTGQKRFAWNETTERLFYSNGTTAGGWLTVNAAWHIGTSAPSGTFKGMGWYDETNDVLKIYDGSAWDSMGGSGGSFSISGLTAITGANLATSDAIAVDDSGTNKKITYAEFIKAFTNLTQHNSPAANDVAAVVDVSASVERKMTLGKMVQGGVSVTSGGGLTKTDASSSGATNLAYTPGTDAEMVTGTSTVKSPSIKQTRDFGKSASSLAVKWNGANDPVAAGLATLAPYSAGSNNARTSATFYDSSNDRWMLLRPSIGSNTGAKPGNLIFEDQFFDFTGMAMSFNLTMGRQTGADNNSFVDIFWGAESDALNNAGDVWGGTNTNGMFVRVKRHATNNTLLFWIGLNNSTIRTAIGSSQFDNTRFYRNNQTGRFKFSSFASASGGYGVEVNSGSTDTSTHEVSFNVLMNELTLYVNGRYCFTMDMGFTPGVGNTYSFGPRYGIMGDDGSGVPTAMFAYLNAFTLGVPDPLNAKTDARPPAVFGNPSGSPADVLRRLAIGDVSYRLGAAYADVTGTPSDSSIGDKAFSNPPSDLTATEKAAVRTAIEAAQDGAPGFFFDEVPTNPVENDKVLFLDASQSVANVQALKFQRKYEATSATIASGDFISTGTGNINIRSDGITNDANNVTLTAAQITAITGTYFGQTADAFYLVQSNGHYVKYTRAAATTVSSTNNQINVSGATQAVTGSFSFVDEANYDVVFTDTATIPQGGIIEYKNGHWVEGSHLNQGNVYEQVKSIFRDGNGAALAHNDTGHTLRYDVDARTPWTGYTYRTTAAGQTTVAEVRIENLGASDKTTKRKVYFTPPEAGSRAADKVNAVMQVGSRVEITTGTGATAGRFFGVIESMADESFGGGTYKAWTIDHDQHGRREHCAVHQRRDRHGEHARPLHALLATTSAIPLAASARSLRDCPLETCTALSLAWPTDCPTGLNKAGIVISPGDDQLAAVRRGFDPVDQHGHADHDVCAVGH